MYLTTREKNKIFSLIFACVLVLILWKLGYFPSGGVASSQTATSTGEYYDVVRVVDGDTFVASVDGKEEKVRLIGINTPETVDPRKPVQCFGKQASDEAKKILEGKKVLLESDPTQSKYDKYGRLLAYAHTNDGIFFNEFMIANGYAYEYTYDVPYEYQSDFKEKESEARAANAGLWNPTTCGGKF